MAKTIKFSKKGGEIEFKERLLTSIENSLQLLSNADYVLNIKKQASKRSLNQNALMWMWFKCIEDETGQDKEDVHDHYCKKFLKREITINGEREVVVTGTRHLKVAVMANFLTKVQADAASEMGIRLPSPEDLAWAEFEIYYQQSI